MVQASVEEAAPEMRRAAMCVCLPDATLWQEVVCMAQAVLAGCIPITFFHDHLHPWLGTFHFRCALRCPQPLTPHPPLLPSSLLPSSLPPGWLLPFGSQCCYLTPPAAQDAEGVLPWAGFLQLLVCPPFFVCSEFSVNIDPVDVFEVKTRVEVVQLDPPCSCGSRASWRGCSRASSTSTASKTTPTSR